MRVGQEKPEPFMYKSVLLVTSRQEEIMKKGPVRNITKQQYIIQDETIA